MPDAGKAAVRAIRTTEGVLRAADVMSSPIVAVRAEATLQDVERLLQQEEISAVAVTDQAGELRGVVSRTDLVAHAQPVRERAGDQALLLPAYRHAREVMCDRLVTAAPDRPLPEVARLMIERRVHRVIVCLDAVAVGVVSAYDVMRIVAEDGVAATLAEVMSSPPVSIEVDESVGNALQRLRDRHLHGIVAMRDGLPVGIVTADDLLLAERWPATTPLSDWMKPQVLGLPVGTPVGRAAAHALAMGLRHVLVMDEDGLKGIASSTDFVRAYADAHGA